MRAFMSLDDRIRSEISDENFDYLKIQCRAKENQIQHESFGKELFNKMKLVQDLIVKYFRKNSFVQISFDGYTGHVAFNEYGERINYTLNIYQVTMNRLPRNV